MKILFYPEAKIVHKKGISINKDQVKDDKSLEFGLSEIF